LDSKTNLYFYDTGKLMLLLSGKKPGVYAQLHVEISL